MGTIVADDAIAQKGESRAAGPAADSPKPTAGPLGLSHRRNGHPWVLLPPTRYPTRPSPNGALPLLSMVDGDGEVACKRDSVGRCRSGGPVAIHLCGLPEGCPRPVGHGRTGRSFPLLGLAPDGVYRADAVTDIAGALLPHRFTLTCDRSPRGTRSIGGLSLLHVRQVAPTWLSPASCPVESRLSSTSQHATPRPPGHLTIAAEPTGRASDADAHPDVQPAFS